MFANWQRVHILRANSKDSNAVQGLGLDRVSMDIIIDDGDHYPPTMEKTLHQWWPYLRPGGYYCVEDVATGANAKGQRYGGRPGAFFFPPGSAPLVHNATYASDATHKLFAENDVFFVDTHVGHRAHDAVRRALGLWMKDRVNHISHVLVIRKREVPQALHRSFLLDNAARQAAADRLEVPVESTSGLDTDAIGEAYCELLRLKSSDVIDALMNATKTLLNTMRIAQGSQPTFISDGPALRQLMILLLNPLLLEPQYHKTIMLSLVSLVAALPPPCVDRLAFWLSLLPVQQLEHAVDVCQQFLTVRLCHTQRIDDAVIAATRVLGMLYSANEMATEAGRRTSDSSLGYRRFYNDAVNQEVNLKEDYRRWKSARGEFSFCDHPYVLEPASKSRVLMYDATAQMTHEFEGAILRSLFVGATSPYLVIKVRRSHLIGDTLLQMSMRKDDLKKPLKVQFVGEDGIDEGGVQKEFFQLIFSQIFDVSYGMFVYDEDSRLFWFNRSSLENEREFELIGIILGAAIYNGVILDARFPHVVYKKLMGQPVGFADLKIAFPPLARGFQQLLDHRADEVESTFGLCMQVSFEDFGEQKTHELIPNGADTPVTGDNRNEYVKLYTQYLLEDSIARQFAAFQRGFHSVCGGECLQLFRWEELELLICGSPVLDFEALERAAQYDDGFSRTHPTVTLLWEVIHELPIKLQKRFLFFCTGSDRVPIKGLGNLNFVVSRNGTDESRLPSAHTCFNHLLLPEYTTKEHLRQQLLKAINDTEGFHII